LGRGPEWEGKKTTGDYAKGAKFPRGKGKGYKFREGPRQNSVGGKRSCREHRTAFSLKGKICTKEKKWSSEKVRFLIGEKKRCGKKVREGFPKGTDAGERKKEQRVGCGTGQAGTVKYLGAGEKSLGVNKDLQNFQSDSRRGGGLL